ncbi:MAG: hypothetical protein EOM12_12155 [Verrucomicrobiae bacterium]|mgnify:CR=1 FL=1|nr:hypothetical protein [Verrucomicrobiae bacterium]NLF21382.1 hypothetical protein [Clostridiaceae bacterium]
MQTQNNEKSSSRTERNEISFVIQNHLGILSTSKTGWTREVNVVSWNERPGRLDIRDWNPEHSKMSRGIGLNGSEVAYLSEILREFDIAEAGI